MTLRFQEAVPGDDKPKAGDLSAVVVTDGGNTLWVGSDEWTSIDRLTRIDDSTYGDHTPFELGDFVAGFDPELGEVDIEGMAIDSSYLWLVGSHSSKRKKVNLEKDGEIVNTVTKKALKEITNDPNRYLLARIPLVDGELKATDGSLTSACLERRGASNELIDNLATDEYIGAIVTANLPSKENGLDIEGLAVRGNRLWLGLRGPVIRGIAIVLEIEVTDAAPGRLELKKIGSGGERYKKHFLDLEGLGIRDLHFDGDDMLILAGPTMTLDGAFYVFRLEKAIDLPENSLSSAVNGRISKLIQIPRGVQSGSGALPEAIALLQADRAEGIAFYPSEREPRSLLVVYDTPSKTENGRRGRLNGNEVLVDLFDL
jgi:hypothetical protein